MTNLPLSQPVRLAADDEVSLVMSADVRMILNDGREATLATLRPDGWPQATIVNYINDEKTIYFDCSAKSQKARNISLDDRVSMSLVAPYPAFGPIYGISLAGHAKLIEDPEMLTHVRNLWETRYPNMSERLERDRFDFGFYEVEPIVVTILNYRAGLGHGR